MQKLHLVGFTTELDGLIFSTRKGAKSGSYVVRLDADVLRAVAESERLRNGAEVGVDRSAGAEADAEVGGDDGAGGAEPVRAPRPESALSPREMQDRLRAGRTVDEVAAEAGVESEWVDKFAAPILAEQSRVVERARQLVFDKPRIGPSALSLGAAVRRNVVDKGVRLADDELDAAWAAYHVVDSVWVVRFRYESRGRPQEAEWLVDLDADELTARNRLASQLGHVTGGRARRPSDTGGTRARKATARKATARKATARKATARKATARKTGGKGKTASKTASKAAGKRTTAKKAASRSSASRRRKGAPPAEATGPRQASSRLGSARPPVARPGASTTTGAASLAGGAFGRAPTPIAPTPVAPTLGNARPAPTSPSSPVPPWSPRPEPGRSQPAVEREPRSVASPPPAPEPRPAPPRRPDPPSGPASPPTGRSEPPSAGPSPRHEPSPPPPAGPSPRPTAPPSRPAPSPRRTGPPAPLRPAPDADTHGPLPPPGPVPVPPAVREKVAAPIGDPPDVEVGADPGSRAAAPDDGLAVIRSRRMAGDPPGPGPVARRRAPLQARRPEPAPTSGSPPVARFRADLVRPASPTAAPEPPSDAQPPSDIQPPRDTGPRRRRQRLRAR